jgi:DNA-binding NtrC family response regulator
MDMIDTNSLKGLRILVIEDEVILEFCIGEIVSDHGGVVVGAAGTLKAATELVENVEFDIAIVDMNLCGQSSGALIMDIVRRGRAVLVSTGVDPHSLPAHLRRFPRLDKPYANSAVAPAFTQAMAKHRSTAPMAELGGASGSSNGPVAAMA